MGKNAELRRIPGVGTATEKGLIDLGFSTVASLRGQSPEDLYQRDCALRGFQVDRCQLYLYRLIVYYADHDGQDLPPEKLRWWYWKDKTYPET